MTSYYVYLMTSCLINSNNCRIGVSGGTATRDASFPTTTCYSSARIDTLIVVCRAVTLCVTLVTPVTLQ